jgi:predicted transposase/invertase (TIGR01784 family)
LTNEEKIERIKQLRLIDDMFFEVFGHCREAVEELIRVILQDERIVVQDSLVQSSLRNLYGRSVRLDTLCIFSDGTRCNVEIQRDPGEDHARRARYNAAMITVKDSEPGESFEEVKNVIVIYVSEKDVFKENKTIYHVKKTLAETGRVFNDGLEEIFVNAAVNDGSIIAELMAGFMDPMFNNPKFPRISAEVNRLKNTEGGIGTMCEFSRLLLEEGEAKGLAKGLEKGMAKGMAKGQLQTIAGLIEQGILSEKEAAKFLGITIPEFKQRLKELEKEAALV